MTYSESTSTSASSRVVFESGPLLEVERRWLTAARGPIWWAVPLATVLTDGCTSRTCEETLTCPPSSDVTAGAGESGAGAAAGVGGRGSGASAGVAAGIGGTSAAGSAGNTSAGALGTPSGGMAGDDGAAAQTSGGQGSDASGGMRDEQPNGGTGEEPSSSGGSDTAGALAGAGGAPSCSGATVCGSCLSWDFEWEGAASPWLLAVDPGLSDVGANGATNALLTHAQYQSSNTSLAVPILIDSNTTYGAEVAVSPCQADGTVNLAGYELTARVFLAGPELTTWSDALQLDTWGPSGQGDYFVVYWGSNPIPTGTWFSITATFVSGKPVNRIGLRLTPTSNWVGTMYIDDVAINLAI